MKRKKKLINVLIVIAVIIGLNAVIAVVYRPIGPALTVSAYINSAKVKKQLEKTYADDKFTLLLCGAERGDLFYDGFKPHGYRYTYKSKKCGNKTFDVVTYFDSEDMIDTYLYTRYKDDVSPLVEKSLDAYFGKGHYCYDFHDYGNESFPTDGDGSIYDYIRKRYGDIKILVASDFDAKNDKKIQNDIINNISSTFDVNKTSIDVSITFDKKDDIDIPKRTELRSSEYYRFTHDFSYGEKTLKIHNELISDDSEDYSDLKCEWEIIDKENISYKTKNKFLNGAKVTATVNGYDFSPDGSITFKEFLDKTNYVYYNGIVEAKNFNPDDATEADIGEKNNGSNAKLVIVNKTSGNTDVENGKVYAISVGGTFTVETELYKDYTVCGLKIGDTPTEEDLVNMFGPYEEKGETKGGNGDMVYEFVDGTTHPSASGYNSMLKVILQNGAIRYLSCSYFEPYNNYTYYYDD